jgi:hypothetical protein
MTFRTLGGATVCLTCLILLSLRAVKAWEALQHQLFYHCYVRCDMYILHLLVLIFKMEKHA